MQYRFTPARGKSGTVGGRKIEASRIYQVSWWSVNDWCQWADLSPKAPGPAKKNRLAGIRTGHTSQSRSTSG